MERILVIGSPGSGKSTLSKQLSKRLELPLLHLDRIFHIDNYHHIPREELIAKIIQFITDNKHFIIDGNYSATLELRLQYADTVIFFDMDTDICLQNVLNRISSRETRDDIAPGFDNSIYHQDFIDYVKDFKTIRQPHIEDLLSNFQGKIIRLQNYEEVSRLLESLDSI